jgi:DNA mismatch endonuclease (patch repair protein)
MAKVGGRDTKPELLVRRALHRKGLRYRLHRRDLPGTPDIVLPRHKLVIFVHGCFWHRHTACRRCTTPKTRAAFWAAKFDANLERDQRNVRSLEADGWKVATVWECETSSAAGLDAVLNEIMRNAAN